MARPIRLGKAAGELNRGMSTLVEFLESNGVTIDASPNTKLTPEQYDLLRAEFAADQNLKEQAQSFSIEREKRETIMLRDKKLEAPKSEPSIEEQPKLKKVQVVGKIDLDLIDKKTRQGSGKESKKEIEKSTKSNKPERKKLSGPNVVGKIELPIEKPKLSDHSKERKIKRVRKSDEQTDKSIIELSVSNEDLLSAIKSKLLQSESTFEFALESHLLIDGNIKPFGDQVIVTGLEKTNSKLKELINAGQVVINTYKSSSAELFVFVKSNLSLCREQLLIKEVQVRNEFSKDESTEEFDDEH